MVKVIEMIATEDALKSCGEVRGWIDILPQDPQYPTPFVYNVKALNTAAVAMLTGFSSIPTA